VKAHAGIFGNEIADRLSKEETQNYYVKYRRIPKTAIVAQCLNHYATLGP